MLRNWITQFGYTAGRWAGDEPVTDEERIKFINQIGHYFGWIPPKDMSWVVEVTKDKQGKYIVAFMRYTTDEEAEKMLGKNYEKPVNISHANITPQHKFNDISHYNTRFVANAMRPNENDNE